MGASIACRFYPIHLGVALARPGSECGRQATFAPAGDTAAPLCFSSANWHWKRPSPPQPVVEGNTEAQRSGCGWPQVPVDQTALRRSNSHESGSSWLICNKELSPEDGVGWSRSPGWPRGWC